ncbi:phage major capsid protein [Gordonia hongkongensis]|uniref:phage major capsid protein n=1 Tax=Gordonia hongkongensis TaxID=1701090 RepID=UPI003D7365CC
MALTKNTATGVVDAAAVSELVIEPLVADAKIATIATVLTNVGGSALRVPVIGDDDDHVTFAAEAAELDIANPQITEKVFDWRKVASLVGISSETVEDAHNSGGGVLNIVGRSLARSLANRVDRASFGNAAPANGWAGIQSAHAVMHDAGETDLSNVDAVQDAIALIRAAGGNPAHVVTSPEVYATLAKAKTGSGSNVPLLGQSASTDAQTVAVAGLPVVVSQHVAANTLYVTAPTATVFAVRRDAKLETDTSALFTSDSVAVRITLRAAFGVVNAEHLAKIDVTV